MQNQIRLSRGQESEAMMALKSQIREADTCAARSAEEVDEVQLVDPSQPPGVTRGLPRSLPGGAGVRFGNCPSAELGTPDSPPDMVGSCLVCFQGVSGCRPGVTHDMIGHRTGSRVPSLRVSAAVRCQLWLFSGQRRHGRAWQLGRVAYKPMLQAGSPMLDAARQPAPISSAAP